MFVTYFDEVKANPQNGQDTYLVGGIAVPVTEIGKFEAAVTALADELFKSADLTPETEFHASYIYFGKGPFKGMTPKDRISLIGRLADLLVEGQPVRRV